jgi:hypothetical protein
MAAGSIGFCVSQLTTPSHDHPLADNYVHAIKITIILLFVSMVSGVLCALIRLLIFYIRRHNPDFGLDWATATTFICQMVAFALAVIWLGTAAFNIY